MYVYPGVLCYVYIPKKVIRKHACQDSCLGKHYTEIRDRILSLGQGGSPTSACEHWTGLEIIDENRNCRVFCLGCDGSSHAAGLWCDFCYMSSESPMHR